MKNPLLSQGVDKHEKGNIGLMNHMSVNEDTTQNTSSLEKLFQKVLDTEYENYRLKLENLELRISLRVRDEFDRVHKKYSCIN